MLRISDACGIGNIFIYVSQLNEKYPVSNASIYSGHRDKYLKFKNLNIIEDDPTLDTTTPDIYINPHTVNYVHPMCRNKVEPTELLNNLLDSYNDMLKNVKFGCAIRIGRSHDVYDQVDCANAKTLANFEDKIKNCEGDVFVSCDKLEYKYKLKNDFGEKVKFVDMKTAMTWNINVNDSPCPYLEFFLLSRCPFLYLTGGKTDFSSFSTFGYMAAIYGNKQFDIIWNS
jgi:hypothetical protein